MSPTTPGEGNTPDAISSVDAPSGRGRKQALVAGGVALVVVAAVVAGASLAGGSEVVQGSFAAYSSSPTSGDGERAAPDGRRGGHHGFGHRGGHGFGFGIGLRGALHGTYVVEDANGDYLTMTSQRGEVTEASGDSVTVRSADDFTQTYQLTDDTSLFGGIEGVGDIEAGDELVVSGVEEGDDVRALHVADLSGLAERGRMWRDKLAPSPDATTEGTSTQI